MMMKTTMWLRKTKRRKRQYSNGSETCLKFALCQLLMTLSTIIAVTADTGGSSSEPLRSLFIDKNVSQKASRPYGTLNGFDVGGPDPICFVSQLVNTSSNDAAVLDDENDVLFWNATQEEARLLPSCPLNTSLQVRQLGTFDPQWQNTLFTGQPYDFQIDLSMTIPNDSPLLLDLKNNSRLHFRLVLCNALLRGSCSPVIDFNYQKVIWEVQISQHSLTESSQDKMQQTPLLTGVANAKQRAIASPFVRYENEDIVMNADYSATNEKQHHQMKAALKVHFEIPHNVQVGTYLFIAHAKLLLKDEATDTLQRLDVAAPLPQFSIQVEHPPNIQSVSRGQKIALAVASGLVALTALVALVFIIYHRNDAVMKLAQAPFLVALLLCVLIGSTFCFTLMPETNAYCTMRGLLVDVPYATSAAILLARCWRVHVTLCNANTFGRSSTMTRSSSSSRRFLCRNEPCLPFGQYTVYTLTFLAKLPSRIAKCCTIPALANPWKVSSSPTGSTTTSASRYRRQSSSLRQTATATETASLCVLLAMPELVLQILGITLAHPVLQLQYDTKAEIGRYTCQSETRWVQKAGLAWMGVLLILAVTVAWAGRDLPQAFNEKTAIFNTASVCAVMLLVSLVFTGITDDPKTAPFVPLFLGCLNMFGLSIAILVNIVLPKILRVLSGEKVVLTHLLARYNQQTTGGGLLEDGSTEDYHRSILQKKSSSVGAANFGQSPNNTVYSPGAIVKLKRDDPLPRKLENGIYDVHGLLGQVSRLCGEGRTPSTLYWNKMRRTIAQLKMELDLVELEWSSEDGDGEDTDYVEANDRDDAEEPSSSMPLSNGTNDQTNPKDKENENV